MTLWTLNYVDITIRMSHNICPEIPLNACDRQHFLQADRAQSLNTDIRLHQRFLELGY